MSRWSPLTNWLAYWNPPTSSALPGTPGACGPRFGARNLGKASPGLWTSCGGRSSLNRAANRQAVFHQEFREDLPYWVRSERNLGKASPGLWTSCGGRSSLNRAANRQAVFHQEFREDLPYWVRSERNTALRILELVEATLRDPFEGVGKPEPLRHLLAGCWSRRITQEHRLVYRVTDGRVDFLQARYHY